MTSRPRPALDETIHSPVRLSIVACLARIGETDFATLREVADVSDSLLSKHLRLLEDSGYVVVTKGYLARRPRTWLRLSDDGAVAFRRYRQTLAEILGSGSDDPTGPALPGVGAAR